MPAVLYAEALELRAPHDAVFVAALAQDNGEVLSGQEVFQLEAPALSAELELSRRELAGLDAQIDVNAVRRGALPLLRERRSELLGRLSQVSAKLKENTVLANQTGKLRFEGGLSAGQWVERNALLGHVFDPQQLRIYALLEDANLARLDLVKHASFVAPWPRQTYIESIPLAGAFTPVQDLPFEELFLIHGGSIQPSAEGEPKRLETRHMAIELKVPYATQHVPHHRLRGRLRLYTLNESLILRWGRQVGRVLWQEFQF